MKTKWIVTGFLFFLSSNSLALSQVCNVKNYGAVGNGVAKDTAAIQSAIDQCPAGGTVLLPKGGVYLSGTIHLKSELTFSIEQGATLRGSRDDVDYPDLLPPTTNTQLKQCKKALVYSENTQNIVISGGGVIDGNGENYPHWDGVESTRPMAIFLTLSQNVTIDHIQVVNSGMWSVVNFENTNVLIDSIRIDSHSGPTRDGIDIVDCSHVVIQNADINSEDDSICLKSGSLKGVHDVTVRNSEIRNSGVANALKLGTASVGTFEQIHFENIKIDTVKQAAIAIESVDGSAIHDLTYKNITFKNAGVAFFILLGQRKGSPITSPGSIDQISFENVIGETNLNWGSAISGTTIGANTYFITHLSFKNVQIRSLTSGGLTSLPPSPPEYAGQYPDPRMWDPLPAYGLYLRHVDGVSLQSSTLTRSPGDPRKGIMQEDVRNFN